MKDMYVDVGACRIRWVCRAMATLGSHCDVGGCRCVGPWSNCGKGEHCSLENHCDVYADVGVGHRIIGEHCSFLTTVDCKPL